MSETIEITREMMCAARDYVPLAEKEAWVAENAPKCFDRLVITADGDPVPPMYMVNTGIKSRLLMAALAALYFRTEYRPDDQDAAMMDVEEYDRWAGGHVLNQLERWKRDEELRHTAYDLIADYKDLEKRFSTQISGLLTVQNDTVIRQNQFTAAQVKEQLPALLEQLKALQEGKNDGE